MKKLWLMIAAPLIASVAAVAEQAIAPADAACAYDKAQMLSLDLNAFDQDLSNGGGGWRKIAKLPGCDVAAADLIREYRLTHPKVNGALFWHEGQLRAGAGQTHEAIELFTLSRKPVEKDGAGWNEYVDASIAFLRNDKAALLTAREQLAKVAPPEGMQLKNGFFELPNNSGKAMWFRWPPNIDVVDGFIKCFGKTYNEAYKASCRPPQTSAP